MKTLLRLHLVLCLAFLFCAVAIPVFYISRVPDPPLMQTNPEVRKSVEAIQDIEHLRKLLDTVVLGTDRSLLANKAALDTTIELLALLLGFAAAGFGYSYLSLRRLMVAVKDDRAL